MHIQKMYYLCSTVIVVHQFRFKSPLVIPGDFFVYLCYMRVFFDHVTGFGKVSDLEVIVNCAYGLIEENESPADALCTGWIPWEGKWYNERSTRLDLSLYKPSKTTRKLSKFITVQAGDIDASLEEYNILYDKYCKHHGFKRDIKLESFREC